MYGKANEESKQALPKIEASTNLLPAPLILTDRKKAVKALISHRAGLSSVGGEKKLHKKKNHIILAGGDTYLPTLATSREQSPKKAP